MWCARRAVCGSRAGCGAGRGSGHVGGDHLPRLVERLELVAPDAALLQVAKPALDERLRLGVAVAAAAVRDAERADREPGRAGGESGAIVGAKRVCWLCLMVSAVI